MSGPAAGPWSGRCARDRLEAQRAQLRSARLRAAAAIDLFGQPAAPVGNDGVRRRLQQHPVLVGDLFRAPHEDSARAIHHMRFDAGGDQSHDLFLQQLPVAGAVLVPDHQVHRQSLEAPIGVRLDELAHQIDVFRVADLQQHDGQIAGYGVAPQAGLAAAVPGEHAGRARAATRWRK